MKRLNLELIDKVNCFNMYIIGYSNFDGEYNQLYISFDIYKRYEQLSIGDTFSINGSLDSNSIDIDISKIISFNNRNTCMRLDFMDYSLFIPDNLFDKRIKTYSFQTFIDIKELDGNGNIVNRKYRFLKNYNTRTKAVYFINIYSKKFALKYKKYLLDNNIVYNVINKTIDLFNNDILYESECIFRNRYGNGRTIYTFTILCVENG